MRTTLLTTGTQPILDLSNALQSAACDILGCGLTTNAWEQATLPIRQGGLGIKDPTTLRPVARLAALANFHSRGTIVGVPSDLLEHISDDTRETLTTVQTQVGPNNDVADQWLRNTTLLRHATGPHLSQQWWGDCLNKARKQKLKEKGTARDQIRLIAQEGPVAAAWLNVTPS